MRVLVTRPAEDAQEIAVLLRASGHEPLLAPMLEIRFHDGPEISLDGVQVILATSANGVRAIARRTQRRDVCLFAVGPQTAGAAKQAGFLFVKNADGDALTLAAAVTNWTTPQRGALLHAAGAEAPKLLTASLADAGFTVRRAVLYEACAVSQLPLDAANALRADALDAVLHFSPRSAQIFAQGVREATLTENCTRLIALCISPATRAALGSLAFQEIRVAGKPNQAALLSLLT
jgi:uroporphyrinogen-III synthase